MLKRLFTLVLVVMVVFSLAACGKKKDEPAKPSNGGNSQGGSAESSEAEDPGVGYKTKDDKVIFLVSDAFKLNSDSWLGIIPTGKLYTKEIDADDVDMVYTYPESEEPKDSFYEFAYEKDYIFGIGDGIYDMVLCDTDDGEKGKVLLQFGIELKDGKITLDFENKK